jgi:hypothetical protein
VRADEALLDSIPGLPVSGGPGHVVPVERVLDSNLGLKPLFLRRKVRDFAIVLVFPDAPIHVRTTVAALKVRFHHHIFPTNLMTNSLTKLPYKQMSHIFVLFVSQKIVANQIGLLQTH